MRVDFTFIVPVRNALAYLPQVVGALRAAVVQDGAAELVVVDNGSTDGTWEWLAAEAADIARLERRPGLTVGALRNVGANLASGTYLAFIDADCVVPVDYAARARRVLARTGAAGTGCRYALPDAPGWIERVWHELHDRSAEGPVAYINSGNLTIRRDAFERVGGFDASLVSGEDAELGQRLERAGCPLYESSEVSAKHLGNPKSLTAFFRKQRWHAHGMFGTVDLQSIDRPTVMTFLFLATLVVGWAYLFFGSGPIGFRLLVALSSPLFVPGAAVVYRLTHGGRTASPIRAIFLYLLYFSARVVALGDLGVGRLGNRSVDVAA